MIQINLLPPEYRVTDKAPIGLFLFGLVGVLFVFLSIAGWFVLDKKVERLRGTLSELDQLEKEKQGILEDIKKKEDEIIDALKRQEMIVGISMSKIKWAQKLYELSKLISKHEVWVMTVELDDKTKEFVLNCFCRGTDERKVADFRKALLRNRTFYSIFKNVAPYKDLRPIKIAVPVKDEKDQWNQTFTLRFKLKEQVLQQQPPQQ